MKRLARMERLGRLCALLAATLVLGGAAPAVAQDGGTHPVDSALEMMNLKTQAGAMPDFVTQSRGSQAEDGYIPIGAKPPARDLKPKSASDVKALTAELDAARNAQLTGKRPKPMGAATPAAASKPAPKPRRAAVQATNR